MLYERIGVAFANDFVLTKYDIRAWWSATHRNWGRSKKTEEPIQPLKAGAVVCSAWVATFREAVSPPPSQTNPDPSRFAAPQPLTSPSPHSPSPVPRPSALKVPAPRPPRRASSAPSYLQRGSVPSPLPNHRAQNPSRFPANRPLTSPSSYSPSPVPRPLSP